MSVTSIKKSTTWGKWTYNAESGELAHPLMPGWYVDFDQCKTSAAVLDWIMQAATKSTLSPADIGDLVLALGDLLDPQATLCSSGVERGPIDPWRVIAGNGYQ